MKFSTFLLSASFGITYHKKKVAKFSLIFKKVKKKKKYFQKNKNKETIAGF